MLFIVVSVWLVIWHERLFHCMCGICKLKRKFVFCCLKFERAIFCQSGFPLALVSFILSKVMTTIKWPPTFFPCTFGQSMPCFVFGLVGMPNICVQVWLNLKLCRVNISWWRSNKDDSIGLNLRPLVKMRTNFLSIHIWPWSALLHLLFI